MRYYTTGEAAKILRTEKNIVREKCRQGHIPAIRPPGFRDWRIPVADLEKLLWDLEEDARNTARRICCAKKGGGQTTEGERVTEKATP